MRSNTRDSATGLSITVSRGRFVAADDTKKMQEAQIQVFHDEVHDGIERFQQYGHSSVPLPPDPNGPQAADVLIGYLGGSRSHPVIIAVDDRRYRPTNQKPGDVGQYHYKGAAAFFTDAGWVFNAGDGKLPVSWTIGDLMVTWADGKATVQVGGSSGPAVVIKSDFAYLGGDPDQGGTFDFVMTASGPSTKAKARL